MARPPDYTDEAQSGLHRLRDEVKMDSQADSITLEAMLTAVFEEIYEEGGEIPPDLHSRLVERFSDDGPISLPA